MKTVTINSKDYPVYADLDDATEYFSSVYNSSWGGIDDNDKAKLLVMATRHIDSVDWRGLPLNPDQKLQFPRMIDGRETGEELLMSACCEEAAAIYENDGAAGMNGANGIKSVRVQDTEIQFKDGKATEEMLLVSDEVARLLGKYMNKGIRVLY